MTRRAILRLVLFLWLATACGALPAGLGTTATAGTDDPSDQDTVATTSPAPPTATGLPATPTSAADHTPAEATSTLAPAATTESPGASSTPLPTAIPPSPTQPAATTAPAPTPAPTSPPVNCPYLWFFANPPAACPEADPLASYAAVQQFEHGRMFWLEAQDVFYLLFEAGAHPSDSRQAYRTLSPLTLKPGASADNRVGETPPPGFYEPVSGFGLIWRNEVEGLDADIRAAFGWAREPEFGYNTLIQCELQQTYSSRTCYLRDPGGQVIVLGSDAIAGSVWSAWGG